MRYPRLLLAQLQIAIAAAAQYRAELFIEGAVEVLWTATVLAPLLVVFHARPTVAGWSFGEALVVVAFFTLLQSLLEGVLNPSFLAIVEHVRRGTFDYVLLMPADAQFLVSTGRFNLWRSVNAVTALVLFAVGFHTLGRAPSPAEVALAAALLAASGLLLYAIWMLAMCSVFFAVKTDQLTDVLSGALDGSRWPSSVFRGGTRFVLTFVIPLGLMTTVPARALLGTEDPTLVATAFAEAALLTALARLAWLTALKHYTSASS